MSDTLPHDCGFEKQHTHRASFNLLLPLHRVQGGILLREADIKVEIAETLTHPP